MQSMHMRQCCSRRQRCAAQLGVDTRVTAARAVCGATQLAVNARVAATHVACNAARLPGRCACRCCSRCRQRSMGCSGVHVAVARAADGCSSARCRCSWAQLPTLPMVQHGLRSMHASSLLTLPAVQRSLRVGTTAAHLCTCRWCSRRRRCTAWWRLWSRLHPSIGSLGGGAVSAAALRRAGLRA